MVNLPVKSDVTPSVWQMVQAIAPEAYQSRLFGVTSASQAAMIMLKGYELGLSFSASFEFVQVIQGKPTLSPRGALALLMNSNELAGFKLESTDTFCRVWMKRRNNGFEHTEEFTIEDAKRANLIKSGGAWETYPKSMLKWRAIGFCIDVLFSDVCGGMKRADELGATVDDEGNVIEVAYQSVPTPAAQPAPAPGLDGVGNWGLETLIDKYGPAAVLEVCDGTIPTERSAIAAAWRALEVREQEAQEQAEKDKLADAVMVDGDT